MRARMCSTRFARAALVSGASGPLVGIVLGLLLGLTPLHAQAGSLRFFEASVGQSAVRTLAGPVSDLLVDVDYAPLTAEGGKLYGISEIEVHATGNLVLTPTGFACQVTSCLFSPSPFAGGRFLRLTGGNDLAGETAAAANLLTIGVTGSAGYIVVVRGEYLDGTGAGSAVGAARTPDPTILVAVPEPGTVAARTAPLALLAALATRRNARPRRANRRCPRNAATSLAPTHDASSLGQREHLLDRYPRLLRQLLGHRHSGPVVP